MMWRVFLAPCQSIFHIAWQAGWKGRSRTSWPTQSLIVKELRGQNGWILQFASGTFSAAGMFLLIARHWWGFREGREEGMSEI